MATSSANTCDQKPTRPRAWRRAATAPKPAPPSAAVDEHLVAIDVRRRRDGEDRLRDGVGVGGDEAEVGEGVEMVVDELRLPSEKAQLPHARADVGVILLGIGDA